MADFISGSFSRIDTFLRCPKKFYHQNVAKDVPYIEGAAQRQGKIVHKQCEERILSHGQQPFAPGYEYLGQWTDPIIAAPGHKFAELQLTVDQNLQPCGYKEWDKAYIRGQVDVMIVNGDVAWQGDWKTGKSVDYSDLQLEIGAALAFQHYSEINFIGSNYIYLGPGVTSKTASFTRTDLPGIWDKVLGHMEEIQVANRVGDWPARRNKWCAWCAVNKMGKCPEAGVKPK